MAAKPPLLNEIQRQLHLNLCSRTGRELEIAQVGGSVLPQARLDNEVVPEQSRLSQSWMLVGDQCNHLLRLNANGQMLPSRRLSFVDGLLR